MIRTRKMESNRYNLLLYRKLIFIFISITDLMNFSLFVNFFLLLFSDGRFSEFNSKLQNQQIQAKKFVPWHLFLVLGIGNSKNSFDRPIVKLSEQNFSEKRENRTKSINYKFHYSFLFSHWILNAENVKYEFRFVAQQ